MYIQEILKNHKLWLIGEGGHRADLSGANLSGADVSGANLSGANLYRADVSGADLSGADVSDADLSRANLYRANLSGADLSRADVSDADLSRANLSGANLSDADVSGANLSRANLSGVHGLLSPKAFLADFDRDADGAIICYKTLGGYYNVPDYWGIHPGAFITAVCNPNRTEGCGSGVNVATLEWVKMSKRGADAIWECRILPEDFVGIVVPYNTDGKFRADRVQLIEIVAE